LPYLPSETSVDTPEKSSTEIDTGSETSHPSPAPSTPPDVRLIELWTVSLSSDIEKLEAGEGALALLSGESLSFRDPATGAERARADLGASAEGFALNGDAFTLVGKSLRRIDVSTGTERWRSDAGPISFSNIAAAEGMVAVASADGYLYLFNSADGRSVKKISAGAGMYGTPLIYGNAVIASGVDKTLRAFDSRTGSALWTLAGEGRFTGDRPLLLGEGKIVLDADSSGGLYAADFVSGALLWKGIYREPMAAGPFAAGSLAAYEDSSGIRFIDKEGSVKTPSGIDGGLLVAVSMDEGILLATAKGVWLVDSGNPGGKAKALARIGLSLAAFRGKGIYAVDSSGKLRAWMVSR
jgi:outer membrane protein assembly factor BamB